MFVLPSLRSLHVALLQFEPEQIVSLLSHFPNLLLLKTECCDFTSLAGCALEVVQRFPRLRSWRLSHRSLPQRQHHFLDAIAEAQRLSSSLLEAEVPESGFGYDECDD